MLHLDLLDLPLPIIFGLFGFIWTNLVITLLAKEVSDSKETKEHQWDCQIRSDDG